MEEFKREKKNTFNTLRQMIFYFNFTLVYHEKTSYTSVRHSKIGAIWSWVVVRSLARWILAALAENWRRRPAAEPRRTARDSAYHPVLRQRDVVMGGMSGWSQLRCLPGGHDAVFHGIEEGVVIMLPGVDHRWDGEVRLQAAVQMQGAISVGVGISSKYGAGGGLCSFFVSWSGFR